MCQSEVLCCSIPASIRRALDDLPRSLDKTYEQVFLETAAEKQNHAHRCFQCLAVSVRPLRAQELAEIPATQFEGPLPTNNAHWRPETPEKAALSACSSLVAVVDLDGSSVVQFSHFSVKEFLTSERLLNTGRNLSSLYILPRSAHTTFAKACLSVLLNDHTDKNGMENSPLAIYAARDWVYRGQCEEASLSIMELMKCLFDQTKPYFSTWVSMYDIDTPFREPMFETKFAIPPIRPGAVPLYYAILCGFRDLIGYLVLTFPTLVNARGGYHATPLHAMVTTGNTDIMPLLLNIGAEENTLDDQGWSPLHRVSRSGDLDVLKLLLKRQTDVDILGSDEGTPLFLASHDGNVIVAWILLRHDAVVDTRKKHSWTPLTAASRLGHIGFVRLLIQNGAAVDSQEDKGWTPLQLASRYGHLDVVQELVACGANVNAQKHDLWTPLHLAPGVGNVEVAEALLVHGAAVDMKNTKSGTPLGPAPRSGELKIARLLIKRGADVNFRDNNNRTPLHSALWNGRLDVVRLLLESLTDIGIQNENLRTPLALTSRHGQLDISPLLIRRGADVNSSDGVTRVGSPYTGPRDTDILTPCGCYLSMAQQ